eukprot:snap_masked-scaffold1137_size60140-processed-gene-0.4 protein:Tk10573 transcript:snap_masked-scaffold1137_size60140-processed-gene-0.4-mRNA-1 annotation:"conserved hypothetical protein"
MTWRIWGAVSDFWRLRPLATASGVVTNLRGLQRWQRRQQRLTKIIQWRWAWLGRKLTTRWSRRGETRVASLSEEVFQGIRTQYLTALQAGRIPSRPAPRSARLAAHEPDVAEAVRRLELAVSMAPAESTSLFASSGKLFMDSLLSVPALWPKLAEDYLPFNSSKAISPDPLAQADTPLGVPNWRRVQVRSVQSKAVIDARTRACVQSLRNYAIYDSALVRKLEIFNHHLHEYPWAKGVAVRSHAISQMLHVRDKTANESVQMLIREGLDRLGYQEPVGSRGIRILSLDGGGMKGIIALEVLRRIESTTGRRIHELFDFICGVSTGSIIASLLTFHKMSVSEVATAYKNLGVEVFKQDLFSGATGYLRSHAYYNTPAYEKVLQGFVGDIVMGETVRTLGTPKIAIVATMVNTGHMGPFVFRNYQYPYRSQSNFKGSSIYPIWAAVRASSAAPGYFDEFALDDKIFHDGGIMTNNATMIAIHEAQRLWAHEPLHCVVSLGMGRFKGPIHPEDSVGANFKPKSLSLAQKFSRIIDAATDTELAHVTLHELLSGEVYFRFNPYLSEYFDMDEVRLEKMVKMREDTQMYIRRNENRFDEVCRRLTQPRTLVQKSQDQLNLASHYFRAQIDKGAIESQTNQGR